MAISIKEFEEETFVLQRGHIVKVLDFFKKNSTKAFTSREVADALGKKQVTTTPLLRKLRDAGILVHKYPYYALASKISTTENDELLKNMDKSEKEKKAKKLEKAKSNEPESEDEEFDGTEEIEESPEEKELPDEPVEQEEQEYTESNDEISEEDEFFEDENDSENEVR